MEVYQISSPVFNVSQVFPASVVFRTVPSVPDAHAVFLSTTAISVITLAVGVGLRYSTPFCPNSGERERVKKRNREKKFLDIKLPFEFGDDEKGFIKIDYKAREKLNFQVVSYTF